MAFHDLPRGLPRDIFRHFVEVWRNVECRILAVLFVVLRWIENGLAEDDLVLLGQCLFTSFSGLGFLLFFLLFLELGETVAVGLIMRHQSRVSGLDLDVDYLFLDALHFTAKYVLSFLMKRKVRILRVIG